MLLDYIYIGIWFCTDMASNQHTRRTFVKLGGAALGAAVLPLASAPVAANPNDRFALAFDSAADTADNTPTSAGWVVDRQAPEGWTADAGRLCIDIDETGPTSGFYGYQGKKYLDADQTYWSAGTGSRLSYRFYIDPEWESDGVGQQTGVWPTLGDANGSISAYPILEYQDSDANDETGEPGFRLYVYESDGAGNFTGDKWVYIGLPKKLKIDPETGGWVTVEAQLQKTGDGAALKWRINNKLVADERGYNVFSPSTQFLEFLLNSANFGTDQRYYYDDFTLREPGTAGKK